MRIMSNEFKVDDRDSIEEYLKTVEGSRYYHGLYLKAVNHPIRREMLIKINDKGVISKEELFNHFHSIDSTVDELKFKYNIDFLIKALCIKEHVKENETFYEITQAGQVVNFL